MKNETFGRIDHVFAGLIRNRVLVIVAILAMTIVMGVLASRIEVKSVFSDLLPTNHPYVQVNQRFKSTFGGSNMVSIMLESVGLDVVMTNSAEGGLELLSRNDFEILVLDWNLPGMSGVDMCRSVRTEGRNTTLAVLFLTGNTSQQDMLEAFASGADDYVTKPFRAAELGARIFALLRRARMAPRPPG